MSASEVQECRAINHVDPMHGRVLQIVLCHTIVPAHWDHEREVIAGEVGRNDPQILILDLRRIEFVYGVALIGALVAGYLSMQKLGSNRRTRVVASGQVAEKLPDMLRICKLDSLLGPKLYPDLETALLAQDGASL